MVSKNPTSNKIHTGRKSLCWLALACLVVPMFASYFFDDMFSSISFLFENPDCIELGWDSAAYGFYTGGYSVLCIFGGLVVCGILLDRYGVRVTGSVFVTLMASGAALVLYAILSGKSPEVSLGWAYAGCMLFGLGSEIAGTAVTRSIAKWFRDGHMALAMGLQLAIARLGTALAMVLSPVLISKKLPGEFYTLAETARPAVFGMCLMLAGLFAWAVFVALDAKHDKLENMARGDVPDDGEVFRLSDVAAILRNRKFILLGLLCVLFYSSIIAFKKFAGAILVPRFGIPAEAAGWMVSMLPFATVIFAPVFGMLVDAKGHGPRWMIAGSFLAFAAHLLLGFAPRGVPFFGYFSMILLGFGYSLVPAALWPGIAKAVPSGVLGTAYSLTYWIQNLGLLSFKMLAGFILAGAAMASPASLSGPVRVEIMFILLSLLSIAAAVLLARGDARQT